MRTRRLSPLGFGARLGLATSALVVLVCVAQSWILAQRGLDDVRRQLIETGRNASEQLASEVGATILSGSVDRLRELAGHARARSGVQYARFFDRHGLLLVSAGDPPTGAPPPGAAAVPAGPIAVGADLWEFQAPILVAEPPPRQLHAPAPLVAGERAGTVAVGVSLESLHALRRRTLTTATLFAALFTPIAVLGAVLLTRAITRPLTVLASAADAIARGDFHATVEVRTRDEIGRLARSFNAMVESLTRSRAALEEKVAELERANRLKSEFLATVSHELRTPLNVIIGYVEILADPTGGRLDEEQAKMIAAIEHYSRLQLDLITNVLDFARLSSGHVSFQIERFALAPLLAEIQALQAHRLQNPRLALTVTVGPDLPMFETDRVKLQEIVHNLVDNAVKFTEAGRVTVVARAGSDSSRVVIEVGDTGPGIRAEDLETIFDAFHQVGASSTRRTGGVGLGLSIVKQLVNALGGTVSVASRIGEGSTFRIDVPCRLRAPGAATPETVTAAVVALDKVTRNVARLPRR
ncbi:MAG: hypothetical protein DMD86_11255, partial [Candidatus Rokuibacteriota bacterium]